MKKPNVTHYRSNEYVEQPWKNGQGTTLEVATSTDQPGNVSDDWRISIASISKAGDYSDFSGYQRSQVMLQGETATLTLQQPDCEAQQYQAQQITMRAMSHLDFDGGVKVSCKPHGGPVKMFNVMSRQSVVSHRLSIISSGDLPVEASNGADTVLFFSLQSNLQIHVGCQFYQLSRYDLLVVNQVAEQALSLPGIVEKTVENSIVITGINAGVTEAIGIMVSIISSPGNNAKQDEAVTFQQT